VNEEGVGEAALPIKILGPGSAPEQIRPTVVENGFKLEWQVKEGAQLSKYQKQTHPHYY
jgi:hypothetical protein